MRPDRLVREGHALPGSLPYDPRAGGGAPGSARPRPRALPEGLLRLPAFLHASNETAYRSASAVWLSGETSACGGRSIAGSYSWNLRAGGGGIVSGKAVLTQSGCVVSADIALPQDKGAGGLLHFRGDVHTAVVNLLFGPPCMSSDRGQLSLVKNGFRISADRASAGDGCLRGPYVMEFVKN